MQPYIVTIRRDGLQPRAYTGGNDAAMRAWGAVKSRDFLVYIVQASSDGEAVSQAVDKWAAERQIARLIAKARELNVETIRGVN